MRKYLIDFLNSISSGFLAGLDIFGLFINTREHRIFMIDREGAAIGIDKDGDIHIFDRPGDYADATDPQMHFTMISTIFTERNIDIMEELQRRFGEYLDLVAKAGELEVPMDEFTRIVEKEDPHEEMMDELRWLVHQYEPVSNENEKLANDATPQDAA